MKRVILTLLLSSIGLVAIFAQSQLGMNYQAVIRDGDGKIIAEQPVGIQISILKESTSGESVYTETFTPTTNQFGLINLVIGAKQAKNAEYSSIDWSVANYFLKVEIDATGGTDYKEMGTSQLLSVPYANYAFNSASSWEDPNGNVAIKNRVQVISDGKNPEEPLFEVRNKNNEIVFAVYENGAKIFLDEETGGEKSRGGFAISGRTTTKETKELLNITPSLTQFYVDKPTAKSRGGFAISGRTTTKEGEADILTVTPNLTQVFVEETTAKSRGGFAISGRTTTKSSGIYDVLTVVPERTDIYVKPSPSKNSLPIGFGVHGLTENTLETTEFFSISNAGTYVATPMAVSLNVTTGIITDIAQTSAKSGGTVTDACCGNTLTGIVSGIVYHTGSKLLTVEEASNLTPDVGGVISAGGFDDFSGLQMLNLKPGTKYKVRAFATDADGLTGYGLPREFTTLPASKLTINVYDGSSQAQPPLNSTVTLWKQDAQEPESISTNKSTHTFTLSKDLIYTYKVEADEYKSHIEPEIELSSNQAENIILTKAETGKVKVKFTAKNQYNNTVGNVHITVGNSSDLTNSAGEATLHLPTGENIYSITVPEGYDYMDDDTIQVAEINLPVGISLTKQHKVTFNVKDHNGIPVTGGEIILTNPDNPEKIISVYDGTGSTYLSSALSVEGNWDYKITSYQGGLPLKGTITVGKEDLVVNVRLPAPIIEYTVKFKILNIDSSPIVGARINLSHLPDLYNGQGITDINGLVTFTKVLATNTPGSAYSLTVFEDEEEIWYQSIEFSENLESDEPSDPIGTLTITITIER